MIKRTYEGIIMVKPEIIKRIGENLDLRLFRRDCNGYSYYGCCVDPLDGAVIVLTKDVEGNTVRMIFDCDSRVRVECVNKSISYTFSTNNDISLNHLLKEHFNVPYVSQDDDFDWKRADNSYQWIHEIKDIL